MDDRDLIYDWNEAGERWEKPPFRVQLDDETLRDGLQSPSVQSPEIGQKLEILHLMERLGLDTADIGLPGAGPHVVRDTLRLAEEIVRSKLKIRANCAARTLRAGHHAGDRDLAEGRAPDRGVHVHRLLADPPVRRELDARDDAQAHRGRGDLRGLERPAGHVRHRGHGARAARAAAPAVPVRDPRRRQAPVPVRHRRARHTDRRRQPGALRARGGARERRRRRARLARPLRPRASR